MRLLLDTHAFIWASTEPIRLPLKVRTALVDPANEVLLSHACVWEIEIKLGLGKLQLLKPIEQIVDDQIRCNGLTELPIALRHIYALRQLPRIHRDPFDRLLVAQAISEQARLVSCDPILSRYPAPIFWN